MRTVAGGEPDGKWPLAGAPRTAFFEAVREIEELLNDHAVARGLEGIPSPDTVLRQQLEDMVTCYALIRARKATSRAPTSGEPRTGR